MQSETGFPSSHQLKSYVAYKSRLKLAARAVLSADAGLLILYLLYFPSYDVINDVIMSDADCTAGREPRSVAASLHF